MAAYAALVSLKHTINGYLNSSGISVSPATREIVESAHNQTTSLQQVLERLNGRSRSSSSRERVDGWEGQIRDYCYKLEDILEYHELAPHVDEQMVWAVATMITSLMIHTEEELTKDNDAAADGVSSRILKNDFGVEMVGHSREFSFIREVVVRRMRPDDLWFYLFSGERGSGRTVAAKNIFDDARKGRGTIQIFDCWAWVTLSPGDKLKQVLLRIIAQVDNLAATDYQLLISRYEDEDEDEDDKLSKYLYKLLENRRYMIVLDDVDNVELELGSFLKLKNTSFPDQSNGSLVILTATATSTEIARLADARQIYDLPADFFVELAWPIIKDLTTSANPSIAAQLEPAGKKIIQNCRGRMFSFAKTLMLLTKSKMTVDQWSKIAADELNPIFMVGNELSEISRIKRELQFYSREMIEMISTLLRFCDDDVRMKISPERFFSRMQIISILGMAGIGKTTFARKLFKDKSISSHFDHFVWITLGSKYKTEDILIDILDQIYPHTRIKGNEKLVADLCLQLSCKRLLIVLDDLCSKDSLLYLHNLFPDIKGTTLITTRLARVARIRSNDSFLELKLLDEEDSWSLLRQKVFATGLCPYELEKAGRKIAEMCDGLPLLILTVADQLLRVEISQEYWDNVASGMEKSVFKNAHDQISEALLPSYQSLPQHLKPCFLYIGIFGEKYEIPTTYLYNLWISEGFLEPNSCQTEEDVAAQCLLDLVDRSIVLFQRDVSSYQMKTCRLHSVFWHLTNSQAAKNKIFHAMNSYEDCSIESMESQRRLCIRNSILLGMEFVQNSMASNTSARSLLCVGPFQQYPVPLNFDLRLLRVMNAITIRLYEFPIEVVWLFHLRYLGLMCDTDLPTSICYLRKLQYLIVKRYMHIKSSRISSLLPVEIWDMKELKHLQIVGGRLPDHECGSGLLKLSTLLDVSAQSCREEVLKWIPNLKRLGTVIELTPDDGEGNSNSVHCLNNIHYLHGLESLKCAVVNPRIIYSFLPRPVPISMFPESIRELSLSGLGYPWEYMSIIGKLKNLEVLKLKNYAFQGPRWVIYGPFEKLKFLLIEDTDLMQVKVDWRINPDLKRLCLRHCYKLKELPASLVSKGVRKIEIVDCSPFTMSWGEQMGRLANNCEVKVRASWLANTHQK